MDNLPVANPFTLTYDAIWALAETNDSLKSWLRSGNRIKYDNVLGDKESISDADLPELRLLSDTSFAVLQNTSSTTQLIKSYTWLLVTGSYNLNDTFNQVSWELFRSMLDWDQVLCALRWGSSPDSFVKSFRMGASSEGTEFFDENRNIGGWAFTWPVEVEMHFPTVDLRVTPLP